MHIVRNICSICLYSDRINVDFRSKSSVYCAAGAIQWSFHADSQALLHVLSRKPTKSQGRKYSYILWIRLHVFYKQCVLPAVGSVSARFSNVPPAALCTRQQISAVILQVESWSCFCQEGICSHLLLVQTGTFNDNPQKCWCVTQAHPSMRQIKPVLEEVGMRKRHVRLDPESIPGSGSSLKVKRFVLVSQQKYAPNLIQFFI